MARITKRFARSVLGDVSVDSKFLCNNKKTFSNLDELEFGLATMSDETFEHHVKSHNNDFANWIAHAVGDNKLASLLKKSNDRYLAAKKIKDRKKQLSKRI